ncbi:MAG TPA: ZIP family metal transporter [Ktedonosporobacter sp.]|nr:ZIP family metal transporter [Ktedonosporobacter sp.]
MPAGTIILLGAFAGLTIYLGLPLAFLKNLSQSLKAFLGMLATGVLVFLLYDVLSKASDPIGVALDEVRTHHTGVGAFSLDVLLLVLGIGLGSVGLVYFNKYIFGRLQKRIDIPAEVEAAAIIEPELVEMSVGAGNTQPRSGAAQPSHKLRTAVFAAKGELSPYALALLIATGIGLHNFSEGLAIGQSAAIGELQLALVLVIGFGLHNMTEGFGIAGPLTTQSVSWKFIALLGLIGGGPTFIGTIVGMIFNSPQVFILFLALAAGAILYVIVELLGVAKRFKAPEIVMWGLLVGFLLGYATDLIVSFAGA